MTKFLYLGRLDDRRYGRSWSNPQRTPLLGGRSTVVEFLIDQLRTSNGRWLHVWRAGRAEIDAFLDDHAYLVAALVQLWKPTATRDGFTMRSKSPTK